MGCKRLTCLIESGDNYRASADNAETKGASLSHGHGLSHNNAEQIIQTLTTVTEQYLVEITEWKIYL